MSESPSIGRLQDGRHLSELSDRELHQEVQRRRRLRAERNGSARDTPSAAQIAQYFTNLELPVGASVERVHAAYKKLVKRYEPATHSDDAGRRAAGTKLLQSLEGAYERLVRHLEAH